VGGPIDVAVISKGDGFAPQRRVVAAICQARTALVIGKHRGVTQDL
jgi:hypothetical protein